MAAAEEVKGDGVGSSGVPAEYEVLIAGGVDWDNIGGKDVKTALALPHVISALSGKKIINVVSGCTACHAFFITAHGEVYGVGRNKSGQLGIGNFVTQTVPQLVTALKGHRIVQASCGRNHSLFLTEDGKVFATGDNKSGQCGQSNLTLFSYPMAISNFKVQASQIAAGADFSLIFSKETSCVYSFGNPQYGQLGHGTDAQYLAKANRVTFVPQPEPREIKALLGKKVAEIAAGANHCLVRTEDGLVYSWGFAGYGRLGLKDQKDQFLPTEIPEFSGRQIGMRSTRIFAGADVSFSLAASGQTYCFGKFKQAGDSYMYPKPVTDLMGWKIRDISAGNSSVLVLADASVIAWKGTIGELGLGAQKSSASPRKNDLLEGLPVDKAVCSYATSFFLIKTGPHMSKFQAHSPVSTASAASSAPPKVPKAPKAPKADKADKVSKATQAKKKDAQEDEDGEEDKAEAEEEEEEEEKETPKKRGRPKGTTGAATKKPKTK